MDKHVNWGRIVSLAAFGAVTCQRLHYLRKLTKENAVEQVSEKICNYLLTHQKEWLVDNKSWVSCIRRTLCTFRKTHGWIWDLTFV